MECRPWGGEIKRVGERGSGRPLIVEWVNDERTDLRIKVGGEAEMSYVVPVAKRALAGLVVRTLSSGARSQLDALDEELHDTRKRLKVLEEDRRRAMEVAWNTATPFDMKALIARADIAAETYTGVE